MKRLIFIILCLVITSCQEERGVVTELKACDSSKDENCQSVGNLENDVIMHVEERFVSHSASKDISCEKGYILIPDSKKSFCVSRDENINKNHLKVRVTSIEEAENYCNSQGKVLIEHSQWMQIAQLMKEHQLNFSLGKKPVFLNSRELFVRKDQSLVNFVSGQAEWVAWSAKSLTIPSDCQLKSAEANTVECKGKFFGAQGSQGKVFLSANDSSQPLAMVKSGSLAKHKKALYHTYIGNTPSKNAYGVRCTYEP